MKLPAAAWVAVIVVFPAVSIVTAELLDVGAVIVNGASPRALEGTLKPVIVGAIGPLTVKTAVALPTVKLPAAAWVAVIVVFPAVTIVTVLPDIVATDVLLLVYVKLPELLDVGAVIVNGAFPTTLEGMLKPVIVGAIGTLTVKTAVALPTVKLPSAAWVAVIVVVPAVSIVTVLPDIVATDVLLLVYVKLPELSDVGAVILNGAPPTVLEGTLKPVIVGAIRLTMNGVDIVACK